MKILVTIAICLSLSILRVLADCPPGQYNPGPDCTFEEICDIPAHGGRMLMHYCDCWCNPGTRRDTITNECVVKCPQRRP